MKTSLSLLDRFKGRVKNKKGEKKTCIESSSIYMRAEIFEADRGELIYLFGFFSVCSIRSTPSSGEGFKGFRPLFLGSFSFFSLNHCSLKLLVL